MYFNFLKKKFIYKVFSYIFIFLILFFLGKSLVLNWQEVSVYKFSFNYYYLILSFLLFWLHIFCLSLVWKKLIKKIEPQFGISNIEAVRVYILSEFGKYVPGQVWAIACRTYLGQKYGVSKKNLLIGSLLDAGLLLLAIITLGLLFLIISFNNISWYLYIASFGILLIGLVLIHPKVFYPIFNFILRKLRNTEIDSSIFLSYSTILLIVVYYVGVVFIAAIAFIFLIMSITSVNISDMAGIIAAFCLANGLGVAALFVPSGLGVREGVMATLLKSYFPFSIAILISLLARVWTTVNEVLFAVLAYTFFKLKNKE